MRKSRASSRRRHGGPCAGVTRSVPSPPCCGPPRLSPRRPDRGTRLAQAACIGADVAGDLKNVSFLLDEARRADPEAGESLAAAVAAAHGLLNGDGDVDTAHRLLAGAIETRGSQAQAPPGTGDAAFLEALHTLLLVCSFGGRPELWEPSYAALPPQPPDVLYLWMHTFADPAHAALPRSARSTTLSCAWPMRPTSYRSSGSRSPRTTWTGWRAAARPCGE